MLHLARTSWYTDVAMPIIRRHPLRGKDSAPESHMQQTFATLADPLLLLGGAGARPAIKGVP